MPVDPASGALAPGALTTTVVVLIAALVSCLVMLWRARRSLRRTRAEHDLVMGSITDHVTFIDPQMRVVWSNWRDDGPELRGQPCHALVSDSNQPCAGCPVPTVLSSAEPAEGVVTCRDGSVLRISAAPVMDDQGRLKGVVQICRDITEKRRLSERLQQAEKMEAVGQLAAGVAHDFNNSLQVILGYAEMLDDVFDEGTPARKHLASMRRAAEQSRDVVRHLLAYSRKQDARPRTVELPTLLEQQVEALNHLVGPRVEIHSRIPDAPLPPVSADPSQVEQVLMNLCVNARDAMHDGGLVEVGLEAVELDREAALAAGAPAAGRYVVLSVADQGEGIADEIRDRIYDPFFTTKAVNRGTGLGLSTVYGIVRAHGGFIELQTALGRGTRFRVAWPVDQTGTEEPRSERPQTSAGQRARILLVEDDAGVREFASITLGRDGHIVESIADGREALDRLLSHANRYDAVVMDVMLPGLNGWTVYRQARQAIPGLQVIFCSGHSRSQLEAEFRMAAPDVEFLQKPYRPNELSARVRHLLNRRAEMDRQVG